MVKKIIIYTFLLLILTLKGQPWTLEPDVALGVPSMTLLNKWLSTLAEREGGDVSLVRFSRGAGLTFWAWPNFGFGLEFGEASGGIQARDFYPQVCRAIVTSLRGRIYLPLFSGGLFIEPGLNVCRTEAFGLFSGKGWVLGVEVRAVSPLFTWRLFNFNWWAGVRYQPIFISQNIDSRNTIAPSPTVDFSGFYFGINLLWRGG